MFVVTVSFVRSSGMAMYQTGLAGHSWNTTMLNMRYRAKRWAAAGLCAFFAGMLPVTAFADSGGNGRQAKEESSSWTSYFSRYLVFWETDDGKKSEKEVNDPKAWKKIAVDFNDFLPDNLPGVAEYRRAARYQLWENQPSHTAQEVYDLYGVSARKGNVLALMKQYEMYLDNQDATDDGKRFFSERLNEACQQVYPVAVTGNADAQYFYARYCINFKSAQAQSWFARAMKQYRSFADRQIPYAQYMLGEIYRVYGEEKTAQDWFLQSAKNGNAEAVCKIRQDVFHENEVWEKLGPEVKGNGSCAVYQALRLIAQTHNNKAVAHAATELLLQMPVGYARKGFTDTGSGFHYFPYERTLDAILSIQPSGLTASQREKSKELVEKYKNKRAAFVDDYLDKFDWNRLSPFGD